MKVVKMSGAGNDFVVLGPDELRSLGAGLAPWVRRVCRRGLSVGADGVLAVEPAGRGRVVVRFFNPDGVESFCGNGSRCAARFALERGYTGSALLMETAVGEVEARVLGSTVRIVLPPPRDDGRLSVDGGGGIVEGRRVTACVPHFIIPVGDVESAPLESWGPALRGHTAFAPEGTNVDVMSSRADGGIAVRTWERGVEDETLACGTGAVAAAMAARLGGEGETIRVVPASGVSLSVTLPGAPGSPVSAILEGDARWVFTAELGPESTSGFPG